jgi:hypothetical protein
MSSQNYYFQDYLSDNETSFRLHRHIRNNNMDSLKLDLGNYKNRLGFTYYQCRTLIANSNSDPNQMRYLDSAFMLGMTPLCIEKHLRKFDSSTVHKSFKNNYLRAFNLRLINLVDSLHYKDQEYRQQMIYWYRQPDAASSTVKKPVDGNQQLNLKGPTKEQVLDSLGKLQLRADSSNMVKLKEIIEKYGWPGAKKVGDYYCQRPGPDVTMFFIHLGNTRRDYQISTLKNVIELCKKQDESWESASSLMFGLHTKFAKEFSEFSFLKIKDDKITRDESFFSVYNMSQVLINSMSKPRIEIKCSKISLFNNLKQFMLSMNSVVPANDRTSSAKDLDEDSFRFIESKDVADTVILYRFVKKN